MLGEAFQLLNVRIQLDRIHCLQQDDTGFGSEPYLWTVFFYSDINSAVFPFHRLVTYTPHSNWTTRGLYPDGVEAGDDVPIPEAMGVYNIALDDGGLDGTLLAGVLFVLLEEDNTDADALKAGHEAFAQACHNVLNLYAESKVMAADKSPTEDEIQAMADQIQTEVEDAIRDKLSWYDALDNQDDFIGFGYRFLDHDQLKSLASRANPEESFSAHIFKPESDPITTFAFNEYEIFGSVRATSLGPPASPFEGELKAYIEAVAALKNADDEIDKIKEQLRRASGTKREDLLAQLKFQRKTVRPPAVKAIGSTRAAYEARRNSISSDTADYLESKEALRKARQERISRLGGSAIFRKTANVAVMRIGESVGEDDYTESETAD
jgi:hypothetical protein